MNLLTKITEWWEFLSMALIGLGGLYKWHYEKKKKDKESTEQLFKKLEELKIKIIDKISLEIEQATTIAKQESLLIELQKHCPECYQKALTKLGINDKEN